MSKSRLHRRTMLRGMFGAAAVGISLPVLDIMLNDNGDALAQGDPLPKRFGLFYWGNGVKVDRWNPGSTGGNYPLSPALMPLAAVKDYVSVVSGMRIMTGNQQGHHAGTVGMMSGAPMIPQDAMGAPFASTYSAPSMDQVVAGHIGGETRFGSIEVGVSESIITGEGTTLRYLSHNGPDNVNPPTYSPREVFNRIFGTGFTPPGEDPVIDPRLALRRSVLDAVMDDASSLRNRLGTVDQTRLDQHLDGVRTLERQIERLESMPEPPALSACVLPDQPGEFGRDALIERNRAMSGLLAMALACDQTRVFSNMFSGSVSYTSYPGAFTGHHTMTHDEGGNQPLVHQITVFIMSRFAELLQALRDTPEGDGNLLDNCVILASTDTADGRGHTIEDYPILVAGRGGGRLRSGVHYRSNGENTSKVLLSCLQAMDLPYDAFGQGGGHVTSPCGDILT